MCTGEDVYHPSQSGEWGGSSSRCALYIVEYAVGMRALVALRHILPMPQVSQRTISFGESESSRLHLIQMISVVVSSTGAREEKHNIYIMHTTVAMSGCTLPRNKLVYPTEENTIV